MVPTSNVMEQSVTTYYNDGAFTKTGTYVITGDQNVALISASAKYMVSDPVSYPSDEILANGSSYAYLPEDISRYVESLFMEVRNG